MTALLAMAGVEKRFGGVVALAGVDLEVRAGEVHALIGENGAGKSTLMKVLAGVHAADRGSMQLAGEPFRPSGPLDSQRRGVAMIHQELNLAPHLSIEDNLQLGRERARWGRLDRRGFRQRVRDALAELGHAELDPRTRVERLGPASRQIVEVARALLDDSRVVVMDEPTSSLAHDDVEILFRVVRNLRQRGVAVVYISHFLDEIRRIADRFTVLREGRTVANGEVQATTTEQIVEAMVGRKVSELYPRVPHERGEPALEVRDLSAPGVARASFTLHRGEILGVAGLVGAGRTELLRALFGLAEVQRGSVILAGGSSGRASPRRRLRQRIGMVSEDRKEEGLALGMSVLDNLTLSRPLARRGFLQRLARRDAARHWSERFEIRCASPRQTIAALSGGNQQKVAIARLLHHDVEILLLDEPTRGIDVKSKAAIYRWMGELAAAGRAVLFVSSYVPELLGVCDRLAVMRRGVLGPVRPIAEWSQEQVLEAATAGTDEDPSA